MKRKILIVDSAKSLLEREKSLLNRDYFSVFTTYTGEDALRMHKREHFDLIVLDVDLPGFSAEDFCKEIRGEVSLGKVMVMLVVSDAHDAVTKGCLDAGAKGYITKPVKKGEFNDKLAGMLGISMRQAIRILVRIKLDARKGSDFFIANTVDVSKSGMLFECDGNMRLGDVIETSFFLPCSDGFKRVVAQAKVMRTEPASSGKGMSYGVKFSGFKEGDDRVIEKFVAEKTGKGGQV